MGGGFALLFTALTPIGDGLLLRAPLCGTAACDIASALLLTGLALTEDGLLLRALPCGTLAPVTEDPACCTPSGVDPQFFESCSCRSMMVAGVMGGSEGSL